MFAFLLLLIFTIYDTRCCRYDTLMRDTRMSAAGRAPAQQRHRRYVEICERRGVAQREQKRRAGARESAEALA